MAKLFANSGDPDQMPHSLRCDLGLLFFLPITIFWEISLSAKLAFVLLLLFNIN